MPFIFLGNLGSAATSASPGCCRIAISRVRVGHFGRFLIPTSAGLTQGLRLDSNPVKVSQMANKISSGARINQPVTVALTSKQSGETAQKPPERNSYQYVHGLHVACFGVSHRCVSVTSTKTQEMVGDFPMECEAPQRSSKLWSAKLLSMKLRWLIELKLLIEGRLGQRALTLLRWWQYSPWSMKPQNSGPLKNGA